MCPENHAPETPTRRGLVLAAAGAAVLGTRLRSANAAQTSSAEPLVIRFSVEGAKAMRRIGEAFTAETGVPLIVETPDDGPAKFQQAASAGKGPDIYIDAHDRIGEWIASRPIHAVSLRLELLEDIDALAWKGFTHRGCLWGYPYAIEAVTLVYNKALVPLAPKSFDCRQQFEVGANWTEIRKLNANTSSGAAFRHKMSENARGY